MGVFISMDFALKIHMEDKNRRPQQAEEFVSVKELTLSSSDIWR